MIRSMLAMSATISLSAGVQAATFYGYTETPNGIASGNAKVAHDAFAASLRSSSVEDFESFALNQSAPLSLSFEGSAGTVSGTLSGNGAIRQAFNGLFPTSPSRELYGFGDLTITFSSAVTAFGFYATDVADLGRGLTVLLNNGMAGSYLVADSTTRPNGSLLFFGVSSAAPITSVTLQGARASDGAGFDDLIVGSASAVPEPATWAMVIGGFGLIGSAMRRRPKSALTLA